MPNYPLGTIGTALTAYEEKLAHEGVELAYDYRDFFSPHHLLEKWP